MQVSWWRARLSASWGVLMLSAWSCGPEREVLGDRIPEEDSQGPSTGAGAFGASTGGIGTAGGVCQVDADCDDSAVCVDHRCVSCSHASEDCFICPLGLEPITFSRNLCEACECVARGECGDSTTECAVGEVCYAGNFCEDGCSGPSCCSRNRCGPPGCAGQPLPCVLGGCPGNAPCLHSCLEPVCECEGDQWRCFDAAVNSAGAGGGAGANDCQGVCATR